MDTDPEFGRMPERSYALSGKIMLTAIVVLFAVIVFMIVLHVYARWYLLRARRRHLTRRSRRRTQLVFYVEPNALSSANRGLDAHVIKSLPVVSYSAVSDPSSVECAVCLSEFEENDEVRLLPKCNHSFHVECIDMWFHSHSTCPLCRSPVEAAPLPEMKADHVAISIDEGAVPEMGSSSGVCPNCLDHPAPSSSSVGDRRKAFEMERVTIDIPRRVGGDDESGTSHGFRSPASRLLSLKRILSMNRKAAVPPSPSPSAGCGTSFAAAVNELEDDNVECGRDESTQQRTRTDTPRPR